MTFTYYSAHSVYKRGNMRPRVWKGSNVNQWPQHFQRPHHAIIIIYACTHGHHRNDFDGDILGAAYFLKAHFSDHKLNSIIR